MGGAFPPWADAPSTMARSIWGKRRAAALSTARKSMAQRILPRSDRTSTAMCLHALASKWRGSAIVDFAAFAMADAHCPAGRGPRPQYDSGRSEAPDRVRGLLGEMGSILARRFWSVLQDLAFCRGAERVASGRSKPVRLSQSGRACDGSNQEELGCPSRSRRGATSPFCYDSRSSRRVWKWRSADDSWSGHNPFEASGRGGNHGNRAAGSRAAKPVHG